MATVTTMVKGVLNQTLSLKLLQILNLKPKPAEVIAMEVMGTVVLTTVGAIEYTTMAREVLTQHLHQNLKPAEVIAMEDMVMEDMSPEADMVMAMAMAIMDKKYLNH